MCLEGHFLKHRVSEVAGQVGHLLVEVVERQPV
eukprot:SAG31_NODE_2457_length_5661_cov_94.571557_3_plen_33_part_00